MINNSLPNRPSIRVRQPLEAGGIFDTRSITPDLEREIADMARDIKPAEYAPQKLPEYVSHADGVDEIGKITAQAVVTQFEALAQGVETMREPLKQWVNEHQRAIDALHEQIAQVEAMAKKVRERGAAEFERLQKSSIAIAETRRICGEVGAKIEP